MFPPEGGWGRLQWIGVSQRAPRRGGDGTRLPLPNAPTPPLNVLESLKHTDKFLMHSAHPSQVK